MSFLFCANCGAANQPQAMSCFACGKTLSALHTPDSTSISTSDRKRLVKERYRIVRQVGTGGFGAVYLAEDIMLEDYPVALKEIRLAGLTPQEKIEATDAFNREVSLLPGLRHGHLPRVFDHFTDPQHWYLVMEFIEGETLESYVQKVSSGRLPVDMVVGMGVQLAEVLDYLHTRQPPIIFRDLKPANIMRTPQGELYLIDFGIARIFKPGQPKDTIAFGSPGYAAPEQYGKAQTTTRSDLYSLGATLHFLLTGKDPANSPFRFDQLDLSLSPAVDELQWLILRMVELNASSRPESALAVKRELQEIAHLLTQERMHALYPLPPSLPPASPVPLYVPSQTAQQPTQPSRGDGRGQGQAMAGQISASQQQAKQGKKQAATTSSWRISRRKVLIGLGAITLAVSGLEVVNILKPQPDFYVYHGHTDAVSSLCWSPDNNRIASSSWDKTVQVWNATSGGNVLTYRGHQGAVWTVDWSPNGVWVASGGEDNTVQVWNASTGEINFMYSGHKAGIEAVTWSGDSAAIASASDDKTVQVWSVAGTTPYVVYTGHTDKILDVAWAPGNELIASCGKDKTVQVWNAMIKGTRYVNYTGHSAQVNAIAWSPDGSRIASASNDGTVQVWDANTGKLAFTFTGHEAGVWGVSWHPHTNLIASAGGSDRTVLVWDATNGQIIERYQSKAKWVCTIAWASNGRHVAFSDANNAVDVWRQPGQNHLT